MIQCRNVAWGETLPGLYRASDTLLTDSSIAAQRRLFDSEIEEKISDSR